MALPTRRCSVCKNAEHDNRSCVPRYPPGEREGDVMFARRDDVGRVRYYTRWRQIGERWEPKGSWETFDSLRAEPGGVAALAQYLQQPNALAEPPSGAWVDIFLYHARQPAACVLLATTIIACLAFRLTPI